ncbi:MAG: RagB/SusD family nutrient uptake outer membrane protein, partial [Alistipes onderdonkii]
EPSTTCIPATARQRPTTADSWSGIWVWICRATIWCSRKLTNWFADEYMFESIRAQTNAYTADRWYCYYKIVYQSNQILDLIPDDATGKALVYKAQALTYRALAYYYLMCVYQDDYMHGGKDKAGVPSI